MPKEQQARAIQRYASEVWDQGNLEAIDEIFASDYVRHGPQLEGTGFEGAKGLKELVTMYRTAFPDLKVPIEAQVGEGDTVMTRWTAQGTNTGPILGAEPTGKSVTVSGFWMHRFAGDQITEEWATWDTHDFVTQLGLSLP